MLMKEEVAAGRVEKASEELKEKQSRDRNQMASINITTFLLPHSCAFSSLTAKDETRRKEERKKGEERREREKRGEMR